MLNHPAHNIHAIHLISLPTAHNDVDFQISMNIRYRLDVLRILYGNICLGAMLILIIIITVANAICEYAMTIDDNNIIM